MQYICLCHVTHRKNLPSILRKGLLGRYAAGHNNRVWLCNPTITGWASIHVEVRHLWPGEKLIILRCAVDPRRVRNGRREMTHFVRGNIAPECITAAYHALTGKLVTMGKKLKR